MPVRAMKVFFGAVGDFLQAWPRLLATDVTVLADQDILFFVLSPVGLATVVVVGAVTLAILTLEQACLLAIGFGETRDLHVRTTDALWYGARHAWSVVMLALRIFIRVLMIALPFLVMGGLIYLLLLGEHDINFYLAERPPIFLFAAGAIVALRLKATR